MSKKLMIIVDPQMDFIGGTMTVKNGLQAIDYACNFLGRFPITDVLITMDWHPITHCSFRHNGGQWNPHCVQHSVGAAIYNKLLKTIQRRKIPFTYAIKGDNPEVEEYSFLRTRNNPENPELYAQYQEFIKSLEEYDSIEIAGIAGDYCVLETIKDLEPVWNKLTVISNCTASIDGGASLFKFCKPNNIRIMEYKKRYEEEGIVIEKKKKK